MSLPITASLCHSRSSRSLVFSPKFPLSGVLSEVPAFAADPDNASFLAALSTRLEPSASAHGSLRPRSSEHNLSPTLLAGMASEEKKRKARLECEAGYMDVAKTFHDKLGPESVDTMQPLGKGTFLLTITTLAYLQQALAYDDFKVNDKSCKLTSLEDDGTWVTIKNLPKWIEWDPVLSNLRQYGEVKSYRFDEYPQLKVSMNGDRTIKIKMAKQIPNVVYFGRSRALVFYQGVVKNCGRSYCFHLREEEALAEQRREKAPEHQHAETTDKAEHVVEPPEAATSEVVPEDPAIQEEVTKSLSTEDAMELALKDPSSDSSDSTDFGPWKKVKPAGDKKRKDKGPSHQTQNLGTNTHLPKASPTSSSVLSPHKRRLSLSPRRQPKRNTNKPA